MMKSIVTTAFFTGLAFAGFLVCPAKVFAQSEPRELPVPDGTVWNHANTGIGFPTRIGELERKSVSDYGDKELDVVVWYRPENSPSLLSIYIYRAALPDASLWFDVANRALLKNRANGPPVTEYQTAAFSLTDEEAPSGRLASYVIADGGFLSTAVAIAPIDGWLLKIRYTSAELSALEMVSIIPEIYRKLVLPATDDRSNGSYPVEDCANGLSLHESVAVIPTSNDATIGDALMSIVTSGKTVGEKGKPVKLDHVVYCRDPGDHGDRTIYRADEDPDGYILPMGDSGRIITVGKGDMLTTLLAGLKDGQQGFPVRYHDLDKTTQYGRIDRLPVPGTLVNVMQDRLITSTTTTWPPDGGSNVEIRMNDENEK